MSLSKTILFSFCILLSCSRPAEAPTNSSIQAEALETPKELPERQKLQSNKLNPMDEGQLSPDFDRFRSEVIAALDRKDVKFIEQLIVSDIEVGVGGKKGKSDFMEAWGLTTNPSGSRLWKNLKKVLLLGGQFDRENKNGFKAPYIAPTWPEGLDIAKYTAITGEEVAVREEPGEDKKILTRLSYEIVPLVDVIEEDLFSEIAGEYWRWVKIVLPDKTKGYVYGKYIHGPTDYRAYFERAGGRWQLKSFIEGD